MDDDYAKRVWGYYCEKYPPPKDLADWVRHCDTCHDFDTLWASVEQQAIDLQEVLCIANDNPDKFGDLGILETRLGIMLTCKGKFMCAMLARPECRDRVFPYLHKWCRKRVDCTGNWSARSLLGQILLFVRDKDCLKSIFEYGASDVTFCTRLIWWDSSGCDFHFGDEVFRIHGNNGAVLRAFMCAFAHQLPDAFANDVRCREQTGFDALAELQRWEEWRALRQSVSTVVWLCDRALPEHLTGVGMLVGERMHRTYAEYVEERDAWMHEGEHDGQEKRRKI